MARTKTTPRKPAKAPTRRKSTRPKKFNPNLDPKNAWVNIDVHLDPVTNTIRKNNRWGSKEVTFVQSPYDQRLPLKAQSRMPDYTGRKCLFINNSKHSKYSNRLQYTYIDNNSKHSKHIIYYYVRCCL